MTENSLLKPTRILLEKAGVTDTAVSLESLSGGRNNRVYKVNTGGPPLLLKHFFEHQNDTRNRYQSERDFVQHAWKSGVRALPEPLACDDQHSLMLYRFIDGRKLKAEEVDQASIDQALNFVRALNREPIGGLSNAAEACFSIQEHIVCINKRLDRLDAATGENARHFIDDQLTPCWQDVQKTIHIDCKKTGINVDDTLANTDSVLSPSDFGFHNALQSLDNTIFFFDFEYAGRDDPAKLCCDFFCQPEIPVDMKHFDRFTDQIASITQSPEQTKWRTHTLMPLYVIKWCSILLNDFLPLGQARRGFSLGKDASDQRLEEQLSKAEQMLNRIS